MANMTTQKELPKSISDQIYDKYFEILSESGHFDEASIEQLKKLCENKGLSKTISVEDFLDSIRGEK